MAARSSSLSVQAPGQAYTVQYSADLNSWINSGSTAADASGIVVYLANQVGPNAFYRVIPEKRRARIEPVKRKPRPLIAPEKKAKAWPMSQLCMARPKDA